MSGSGLIRIMFVCTGNLCRSPTAEGMLRARVEQQNRSAEFFIDSSGIHAQPGHPPAPLAIEVATDFETDLAGQVSRPFEPEDFNRFDHIIAMDLGHLDFLQATRPDGASAIVSLLLADVGNLKNVEVPDPYGQDREAYEFSARLISKGIDHLLDRLVG